MLPWTEWGGSLTEGLQGEGGLEQALGWCGLVGMPRSSAPAPRTCPSPHVRQHLWQRVRHHPAPVLGHGALPHPDAASQGVHPLPPDPQPAAAAPGRVLPARLVLHQRHRHERGESPPPCPADPAQVPTLANAGVGVGVGGWARPRSRRCRASRSPPHPLPRPHAGCDHSPRRC